VAANVGQKFLLVLIMEKIVGYRLQKLVVYDQEMQQRVVNGNGNRKEIFRLRAHTPPTYRLNASL
jgi:hypothetical protein